MPQAAQGFHTGIGCTCQRWQRTWVASISLKMQWHVRTAYSPTKTGDAPDMPWPCGLSWSMLERP